MYPTQWQSGAALHSPVDPTRRRSVEIADTRRHRTAPGGRLPEHLVILQHLLVASDHQLVRWHAFNHSPTNDCLGCHSSQPVRRILTPRHPAPIQRQLKNPLIHFAMTPRARFVTGWSARNQRQVPAGISCAIIVEGEGVHADCSLTLQLEPAHCRDYRPNLCLRLDSFVGNRQCGVAAQNGCNCGRSAIETTG
jgi:hypothetical protein